MKEKISAEVLFNRQVNYMIIEKMWRYLNKEDEIQELYDLLDINKNAYSRIRKAETFQYVDLDKRWDKRNSTISSMGLSKEIMTGKEMMKIEGITKEDWEKYIHYRYKDKKKTALRASDMQTFNRKLNAVFASLTVNSKDRRDVSKLYYFFKYRRSVDADMPDREMADLKDSLTRVDIGNMKACDMELRKEVYELLKEKYEQLHIIIQYSNL